MFTRIENAFSVLKCEKVARYAPALPLKAELRRAETFSALHNACASASGPATVNKGPLTGESTAIVG